MAGKKKCIPIYLEQEDFDRLSAIANSQDRLPMQQANRMLRIAIREWTEPLADDDPGDMRGE